MFMKAFPSLASFWASFWVLAAPELISPRLPQYWPDGGVTSSGASR
jgi:hypothetical protein